MPVYRAERYLSRCVNSVLAQTFMNFELILIDDGSPDASGQLCDHYAVLDPRVRVIHQENAGSAGARNAGLAVASGKYIAFVDSDDWVERDYLERLYYEAERTGADVVGCWYAREHKKKSRVMPLCFPENPEECLEKTLTRTVSCALWDKLFRHCFLTGNGIGFVEGLDFGEDRLFCTKVFVHARIISSVDRPLYHYVETSGSMTDCITEEKMRQLLAVHAEIQQYLQNHGVYSRFQRAVTILEADVHILCVFNADRKTGRKIQKELVWDEPLLYKEKGLSFPSKCIVFCYLHHLTFMRDALVFAKSVLRKIIQG